MDIHNVIDIENDPDQLVQPFGHITRRAADPNEENILFGLQALGRGQIMCNFIIGIDPHLRYLRAENINIR